MASTAEVAAAAASAAAAAAAAETKGKGEEGKRKGMGDTGDDLAGSVRGARRWLRETAAVPVQGGGRRARAPAPFARRGVRNLVVLSVLSEKYDLDPAAKAAAASVLAT
uniref:Uncharacterized protein n=1 Tax=Oryza meridionalis TaxID=40149 RepID=A0A0E0DG88_9ORYZ